MELTLIWDLLIYADVKVHNNSRFIFLAYYRMIEGGRGAGWRRCVFWSSPRAIMTLVPSLIVFCSF